MTTREVREDRVEMVLVRVLEERLLEYEKAEGIVSRERKRAQGVSKGRQGVSRHARRKREKERTRAWWMEGEERREISSGGRGGCPRRAA